MLILCFSERHEVSVRLFTVSLFPQSILKKSVTMQHTPSAVYHYGDAGGGSVHHSKVNAIFQAAKKDLLQVIHIQVAFRHQLLYLNFSLGLVSRQS